MSIGGEIALSGNTAGATPVALLWSVEPPLSDKKEVPLLVLLLVFSSTDNLSITGPSFESIFSSIRFSRRTIGMSNYIHTILLRSRARMFVGRPPGRRHTSICHVLLTEVFNWIVRRQTHVLCKALENSRSIRIWLLSVRLAVTAEWQKLVIHFRRSLYHCRKRRRRNWRRDQSPWSLPQTPFNTTQRQTTIKSTTVQRQKQKSEGFLGQNGLSRPLSILHEWKGSIQRHHRKSRDQEGRCLRDACLGKPRSLHSQWLMKSQLMEQIPTRRIKTDMERRSLRCFMGSVHTLTEPRRRIEYCLSRWS